jgi:hypothetical protein
MSKDSTTTESTEGLFAGDAWFDPIEAGLRGRIRGFIEAMLEEELAAALGGGRYERGRRRGHRHGKRARQLLGSFGPATISVPRGRLSRPDGTTEEWRSAALARYARMTRQVEALIAASYLAGTNTRRVRRALGALFRGAVGKDVVSRTGVASRRFPPGDRSAMAARQGGLGGLEPAFPGRGRHCSTDPGRHGGAGAARPQGDQRLALGGARRAQRRAEGVAVGARDGW